MGFDPEWGKVAAMKGLAPVIESDDSERAVAKTMFAPPGTWVLPIVTASEANGREWRKRSNRTQNARRIVSREFGCRLDYLAPFARHFHAGRPLSVRLTRLGGRKLDAANLGPALKATEDAVALMLGADDGDSRWCVEFHQEPQASLQGVRIELEAI
jgi:hypothetical protein